MNFAKRAPEAACCANCTAFRGPVFRDEAQRERAVRGGVNPDIGTCRLNPTPVPKMKSDWCRQHARVDIEER